MKSPKKNFASSNAPSLASPSTTYFSPQLEKRLCPCPWPVCHRLELQEKVNPSQWTAFHQCPASKTIKNIKIAQIHHKPQTDHPLKVSFASIITAERDSQPQDRRAQVLEENNKKRIHRQPATTHCAFDATGERPWGQEQLKIFKNDIKRCRIRQEILPAQTVQSEQYFHGQVQDQHPQACVRVQIDQTDPGRSLKQA